MIAPKVTSGVLPGSGKLNSVDEALVYCGCAGFQVAPSMCFIVCLWVEKLVKLDLCDHEVLGVTYAQTIEHNSCSVCLACVSCAFKGRVMVFAFYLQSFYDSSVFLRFVVIVCSFQIHDCKKDGVCE